MLKAICFYAFIAFAFVMSGCGARAELYQRMLLLAGSVTVGGGGSGEIPTRCLDQFSHQPPTGLSYKSVPAGLGQATVRVGSNPPITLQRAIKQGIISLEGFDGVAYTKLRIKNRNPSQTLRVTVSTPTVILPDQGYPDEDLKGVYGALASYQHRKVDPPDEAVLSGMSPQEKRDFVSRQATAVAMFDNSDIWRLRQTQASEALNRDSREKLAKAGISADAAAMYDLLVQRNIRRGAAPAFLVLRSQGLDDDGAAHAIFTGSGDPIISLPFKPLGDAYDEARARWKASVGNRPTVMALAGDGSRSDFDVTNVLLAVASAGSGGSGGSIIQSPTTYPDPPESWRPFPIVSSTNAHLVTAPGGNEPSKGPPSDGPTGSGGGSGGSPPAVLAADNRRGPYKYTEKFERGEATAYARQEMTIATMAAAIRRFLRGEESKTLSPPIALQRLKAEVEGDLDDLYGSIPPLRNAEKGGRPGADLEATVDGTRGRWVMADDDPATRGKARRRALVRLNWQSAN